MNVKVFTYHMPVKVFFGKGELEKIGSLTRGLGKRALLVTGKKSMKKLGVTDKVIELLKENSVDVTVFDEVLPNPADKIVEEGAEAAVREKSDVIIGLGGGSSLDTAKGISIVATQGGNLWDYIGGDKVKGEIIPIIAIPTTAGTGSETTPYSVFTKKEIMRKDGLASVYTFPKISIVDPILMKSMPSELTAETGFDALSHAVEAYLSVNANPFSDTLALKAISLINDSLVEVTKNEENLEARSNMALASTLAGMAIAQAGVVIGHGFGMSIGGILDTPHGRTVGVLLPYVMSYNLPEVPERIAPLTGCFNLPTTKNSMNNAQKVIEAIKKMMKEMNFPTRLRDIGVDRKDTSRIVKDCMDRPDMANNPRKFDRKSAQEFLEAIM